MHKLKLFLIDDNLQFRTALRRFLTEQELLTVVGERPSGQHIVDAINIFEPDVVICDLAMPDLSGFTIIKQIRRVFPKIGIVALTLFDNQDYKDGALESGANMFVGKSEIKSRLVPTIIEAFRLASSSDTNPPTAIDNE